MQHVPERLSSPLRSTQMFRAHLHRGCGTGEKISTSNLRYSDLLSSQEVSRRAAPPKAVVARSATVAKPTLAVSATRARRRRTCARSGSAQTDLFAGRRISTAWRRSFRITKSQVLRRGTIPGVTRGATSAMDAR